MTYGYGTPEDLIASDRGPLPQRSLTQKFTGAAALAASLLVGGALLYARFAEEPDSVRRPAPARNGSPYAQAKDMLRTASAPRGTSASTNIYGVLMDPGLNVYGKLVDPDPNVYGELLDPKFAESSPVSMAQSHPLGANFAARATSAPSQMVGLRGSVEEQQPGGAPQSPQTQVAEAAPEPPEPEPQIVKTVPLPTPRPANLGFAPSHIPLRSASRQLAKQQEKPETTTVAAAEPDNRSFFDKLFGQPKDKQTALAYAAPEDGALAERGLGAIPPHDHLTAVYNIAAHTVYMPDGSRLEAHSGLGDLMDDPHHVNERMRGATPPAVYDLALRESPFHGVQALRLIPESGDQAVFGRTGLLAHTYMLGPLGASNGCVSFRDYTAFLQAYMNGQVKRLVVVAGLN